MEGGAGFVEQVRVAEIAGREVVAVVAANPGFELGQQGWRQEDGLVGGVEFALVEDDAEAEAGGAAAVAHALADVNEVDGFDGGWADDFFDEAVGGGGFFDFAGGDERRLAIGERDELAVEEVGADGFFEGELAFGGFDHMKLAAAMGLEAGAEGLEDRGAIEEGTLVAEEDVEVADGDDVVVEDAGVDGVGVLLDEHRGLIVEPVA